MVAQVLLERPAIPCVWLPSGRIHSMARHPTSDCLSNDSDTLWMISHMYLAPSLTNQNIVIDNVMIFCISIFLIPGCIRSMLVMGIFIVVWVNMYKSVNCWTAASLSKTLIILCILVFPLPSSIRSMLQV